MADAVANEAHDGQDRATASGIRECRITYLADIKDRSAPKHRRYCPAMTRTDAAVEQ